MHLALRVAAAVVAQHRYAGNHFRDGFLTAFNQLVVHLVGICFRGLDELYLLVVVEQAVGHRANTFECVLQSVQHIAVAVARAGNQEGVAKLLSELRPAGCCVLFVYPRRRTFEQIAQVAAFAHFNRLFHALDCPPLGVADVLHNQPKLRRDVSPVHELHVAHLNGYIQRVKR